MRPTIIIGLLNDSRVMQEEIFGPVTCVLPFETESEAVMMTNDVKYGLSACVWSKDLSRAHRVAQKLKASKILVLAISAHPHKSFRWELFGVIAGW